MWLLECLLLKVMFITVDDISAERGRRHSGVSLGQLKELGPVTDYLGMQVLQKREDYTLAFNCTEGKCVVFPLLQSIVYHITSLWQQALRLAVE
jgi:hypothetical protein